jgi:hypothetical protein
MAAPQETRVVREVHEVPATDASTTTVERAGWAPAFGAGMLLGVLGAIGVIISCFTTWTDPGSAKPVDVPVAFLGDHTTTSSDPSLLIVLIPIALVLVIGAVAPFGAAARLFGGLAMLAVCGLFAFQLNEALGTADTLGDALGTGFYIGAIGGFLALMSGFVPTGWLGRREVVT